MKIVNKVKEVLQSKNKQKSLFDELKVGDVVFATMSLEKKELKQVPLGHRERPFLIAYKNDKNVYAYMSSGTNRPNFLNHEIYKFSKKIYHTSKDSYFYLNKLYVLKPKHLLNKYRYLNDFDLTMINHYLTIAKGYDPSLITISKKRIYLVGDCISFGKRLFLVYKIENKKLYTYRILTQNNGLAIEIKLNHQKVFVDKNNIREFKSNGNLKVVGLINQTDLKLINTGKKQKARVKKSNKITFRYPQGQMFTDQDVVYLYLYTSDGDYGLNLNDYYDGVYGLVSFDNLDKCVKDEFVSKDILKEIIDDLKLEKKYIKS